MIELLIEWRDAREEVLRTDWSTWTVESSALWMRLGHAESRLMAYARQLPAKPVAATRKP